MPSRPAACTGDEALGKGAHRLVGEVTLDLGGQLFGRGVTLLALGREGSQTNGFERPGKIRIQRAWPRKLAALSALQQVHRVVPGIRRTTSEQVKERRAQAENVAGG